MGCKQGKPYCLRGNLYPGEVNNLNIQCRNCENCIYIGCPSFKGQSNTYPTTVDYIRWLSGELKGESISEVLDRKE